MAYTSFNLNFTVDMKFSECFKMYFACVMSGIMQHSFLRLFSTCHFWVIMIYVIIVNVASCIFGHFMVFIYW